jgi:hypothetical protein
LFDKIATNSEFTSLVDLDELKEAIDSVNAGSISLKEYVSFYSSQSASFSRISSN